MSRRKKGIGAEERRQLRRQLRLSEARGEGLEAALGKLEAELEQAAGAVRELQRERGVMQGVIGKMEWRLMEVDRGVVEEMRERKKVRLRNEGRGDEMEGAVEEGGEFRKEVERMRKRVRELEEGRREREREAEEGWLRRRRESGQRRGELGASGFWHEGGGQWSGERV